MPMKDSAAFLKEALDSIIKQSYTNWELLIIDDHSCDDSRSIAYSFEKEHRNIFCFSNLENGIIPALVLGLSRSKGEFITRMDSDDLMPENRLELMHKKWNERKEPKTIVTGKVRYFGKTISKGYQDYENWLNTINSQNKQWQNVYRECVIASPNWFLKKSALLEMGGFTNLKYPEDYHLVLRWYAENFQILCCSEITLLWREHPQRTSRNSANYGQRAFFDLKISHFINHKYSGSNLLLWGTGTKARISASLLKKHKIPFDWMDLNPQHYPQGIQGKTIKSFQETKLFEATKTQILLAVYPSSKEKTKMESYLDSQNFLLGQNYWYL